MFVGLFFVVLFIILWHEYALPFLCVGFMLSGPTYAVWSRTVRRAPPEPLV
jgi:hypothetical protein